MRSAFAIATLFIFSLIANTGSAETFRVLLLRDAFPPYYFSQDDLRTGITKDLCTAIGYLTGDHFVFIHDTSKQALKQFEQGKVDIEVMIHPTWRKNEKIQGVYTIPHSKSVQIVLFAPSKRFHVKAPVDLLDRRIGVVRGYLHPAYEPLFAGNSIRKYEGINENNLLSMLRHGKLDQIFINKTATRYWMKQNPAFRNLEIGSAIRELDMMIRVHPDKADAVARFNIAIRNLQRTGAIEKIYDKYQ